MAVLLGRAIEPLEERSERARRRRTAEGETGGAPHAAVFVVELVEEDALPRSRPELTQREQRGRNERGWRRVAGHARELGADARSPGATEQAHEERLLDQVRAARAKRD